MKNQGEKLFDCLEIGKIHFYPLACLVKSRRSTKVVTYAVVAIYELQGSHRDWKIWDSWKIKMVTETSWNKKK